MKIRIGIVDDHQLFLKSLGFLISSLPNFELMVDAVNGEDILEKLRNGLIPDILLIDVNMPRIDGVETAKIVNRLYPKVKMVALTMKDEDATIIRMLQAGCSAYLLKDVHPNELEKALNEVNTRGYYNADKYDIGHRRFVSKSKEDVIVLTEREKQFLRLACSDLTYKQVAKEMSLSERTIDGYRESLFEKFNVKSRVGMALEAIRRNLVALE
jgi:DNA-binding NarL/FixJ family response regulator